MKVAEERSPVVSTDSGAGVFMDDDDDDATLLTQPYTKFLAVTPTGHQDTRTLLLYNITSSTSVSTAGHRAVLS